MNINYTFDDATSFNQDIKRSWDVSRVTNMSFMFKDATSSNQVYWIMDLGMCVSCERYDLPVFQCMFPYNQVIRYWDDDDEYMLGSLLFQTR
jgi:hypothetical protein